ncbi:MAG: Trk family potassium uptake protein, partial [Clostridia bacterium]|nr:Trk family potassium uptake protein [Clostridia bacterium]
MKFTKKIQKKMSVWRYLALGYLLIILIGSILLVLPFSTKSGSTTYLDALFTATSATCVTGLIVVDTAVHWSGFGQAVILLLIQTGGLGFATFVTVVFLMIRRGTLGVYQKRTIMQTFGGKNSSGAGTLILRVVVGTFIIEAVGAFALAFRFVPDFGWGKGIYIAIFHAVSAFCNAGFDVLGVVGEEYVSLTAYATDPLVSIVIPLLIFVGGLGFCV